MLLHKLQHGTGNLTRDLIKFLMVKNKNKAKEQMRYKHCCPLKMQNQAKR